MKAARLTALKQLELEEIARPEPETGEVLVELKAGGVCGTDAHIFAKEEAFSHPLGHEVTGKVVENNSNYDQIQVGDRVVVDNATNCGVCRFCKNGQPEYCRDIYNPLMEGKLSFQEYIALPARSVYPFEGLSYQAAALAEPLTVALEMLETAEVKPGQDIAVFGPGPIGLMTARIARHIGVNSIYMTGRSHSHKRLALAEKIGVEGIVRVDEQDTVAYFKEENPELDRVLITAPPYTIKDAVQILRFGGILTYIGFSFDGSQHVELNFNDIHLNKLQIRATHAIPNRFYPQALQYIKQGIIDPDDYISHRFDFENIQQALETTINDEVIKVMIDFS